MEKEVLPSSKVGYICVPKKSTFVDYSGIELTISGWGATPKKAMSDVLQVATVFGVSNEECNKKMDSITENMICALKEETDTCYGDSGGNWSELWLKIY